jgi:heme-degrading monooxygenase HmoA
MILEISTLRIDSTEAYNFEKAFRDAEQFFAYTKGYITHELHRSTDNASDYLLIVEWRSEEEARQRTVSELHPHWHDVLARYLQTAQTQFFTIVAARGMHATHQPTAFSD